MVWVILGGWTTMVRKALQRSKVLTEAALKIRTFSAVKRGGNRRGGQGVTVRRQLLGRPKQTLHSCRQWCQGLERGGVRASHLRGAA